jgi:hypothetical protein
VRTPRVFEMLRAWRSMVGRVLVEMVGEWAQS